MTAPLTDAEAEELIAVASNALTSACQNSFRMRVSVPVRKDDTDVAIKSALDVASTLLAERRALRARVAELEQKLDERDADLGAAMRDQP